MNIENSEQIYKYGDKYYSFEEICEIYAHIYMESKKNFRDCLSHFILAQIFRKAHHDREAYMIEDIANLEKKHVEKRFSKIESFLYHKAYSLKVMLLFGLNSEKNSYKNSEFINGEWLLNKLVSLTLGSRYQRYEHSDLSLIDYNSFLEDECLAIVENFKRNIHNEEIVYYRSPKKLEKKL